MYYSSHSFLAINCISRRRSFRSITSCSFFSLPWMAIIDAAMSPRGSQYVAVCCVCKSIVSQTLPQPFLIPLIYFALIMDVIWSCSIRPHKVWTNSLLAICIVPIEIACTVIYDLTGILALCGQDVLNRNGQRVSSYFIFSVQTECLLFCKFSFNKCTRPEEVRQDNIINIRKSAFQQSLRAQV